MVDRARFSVFRVDHLSPKAWPPLMYSITENIYYSQLSSVAILLQPEPVSHRIVQGKIWFSVLMCYRLAVFPSLPRVYL
jgi:hypothetical protein